MGTCYTVYMLDTFGFEYVNRSPEYVINKLKERFPYAKPVHHGNMITFDADKKYPESADFIEFVYSLCDAAYYQTDNNCDMNPIPREARP